MKGSLRDVWLENSVDHWKSRLLFVEILGEGSAAVSFLYRERENGRLLVVKQYKHTVASMELDRLMREVNLLQQLDHDDIPQYVDHYIDHVQGRPLLHLVYEYIDGRDVRSWLQERRSTQAEIISLIDQLLTILVYLQALQPAVLH